MEKVLILVIDGCAPAYLTEQTAPKLFALARQRGFVKAVRCAMPSVTNVNHACILSGRWPAETGVAVWHTRVWFWLVSAVFSAFWGGLAYGITALFTEDAIWQWMVFGLAVLVALGSHLLARRYTQNIEEV